MIVISDAGADHRVTFGSVKVANLFVLGFGSSYACVHTDMPIPVMAESN